MSFFSKRHRRALTDAARKTRAGGGSQLRIPLDSVAVSPLIAYGRLTSDVPAATTNFETDAGTGTFQMLRKADASAASGADLDDITNLDEVPCVNRDTTEAYFENDYALFLWVENEWHILPLRSTASSAQLEEEPDCGCDCTDGTDIGDGTTCCRTHDAWEVDIAPFGTVVFSYVSAEVWESAEFDWICADGTTTFKWRLTVASKTSATIELIQVSDDGCGKICIEYEICCLFRCLCSNPFTLSLYDLSETGLNSGDLDCEICLHPSITEGGFSEQPCASGLYTNSVVPEAFTLTVADIESSDTCHTFNGSHTLVLGGGSPDLFGTSCTWGTEQGNPIGPRQFTWINLSLFPHGGTTFNLEFVSYTAPPSESKYQYAAYSVTITPTIDWDDQVTLQLVDDHSGDTPNCTGWPSEITLTPGGTIVEPPHSGDCGLDCTAEGYGYGYDDACEGYQVFQCNGISSWGLIGFYNCEGVCADPSETCSVDRSPLDAATCGPSQEYDVIVIQCECQ